MDVNVKTWGIWFLTCVIITTPVNILVNYAIFRLPTLKHRPALRVMLSLSLIELGQLLNSAFAAFRLLIGYEPGHTMTIIFSVINNGFWCSMVFNHLLLVADRLMAVIRITSNSSIPKRKRWRIDPSIIMVWVAGFAQTTVWHISGAYVYFDKTEMRWNPRTEAELNPTINLCFDIVNLTVSMLGVIGTTIIFGIIHYRRCVGDARNLPKRLEYRILIQNTLIMSCVCLNMFPRALWFTNETIRSNVLIVILICASPYLYLLLNRDIRRSFSDLLRNTFCSLIIGQIPITSYAKTITLSNQEGKLGNKIRSQVLF